MKLTKYGVYINIWGSIVMSAVLSAALPLLSTGHVTLEGYFSEYIVSFFLSLFIKLFTPVLPLGEKFSDYCQAKEGTLGRQLNTTLVTALMLSFVMSLAMTWWGLHGVPNYQSVYWASWIGAYPWVLVIVYITSNIGLITGRPIVNRILNFEMKKAL